MVERVVVGAADTGTPAAGPNDAALAAKAAGTTASQPGTETRPSWLPEKFASAEAMATAYAELEKKQGTKAAEPVADAKKDETPVVAKTPEQVAADAAAAKAVTDAGLNFDDLGVQIATSGDISKEARAALVAKGIPEAIINQHIAATKAQITHEAAQAFAVVGGEEQFKEMSNWAAESASESQLLTYNTLVQKGDAASVKAAMEYLKGIHVEANGSTAAKRVEGSGNGAPNNEVYTSRAQVTADMKNPLYKTDAAFRAKVEAKVKRSDVL